MNQPKLGRSFNPRIPSVYSVEVCSACDLSCPGCPRELPDKLRPAQLLDLDLARTIAKRDLGGTRFLEFQQTGEPTLHKHLKEIISFFKGKVFTGFSTHGMHIDRQLEACLLIDYITISVDALDEGMYNVVRKGGNLPKLLRNIDLLCKARGGNPYPVIDLQIVEYQNWDSALQLKKLHDLVTEKGWRVNVRSIDDCFITERDRSIKVDTKDLCLNPWLSVNIASDGSVIACCLDFGKELTYGNLKDASLEEIWNESPLVKELRRQHLAQEFPENSICARCYKRSPSLLHEELYSHAVNSLIQNLRGDNVY